jgi:hypothetical protein
MTATPLDGRVISTHILAIEQGLDLDEADWRIYDVHLWPIYRLELYRLLFNHRAGLVSANHRRLEIGTAFSRSESSPPSASGAVRVWLVSDGISFATLGDEQIERFCGPLHDALFGLGIDAVLIDRGSRRRRPGPTPTRWWMPLTYRAKLFGALRAAVLPDRRHDRLVERIGNVAAQAGIVLPTLSAKRFNAMTNAMLSLASTLASRMRRERVRAVFVVGYYDVAGYAYVLAAHRVGAVSVDVQHGVTGDLNLAYAKWNVEPAAGLALLPSHFWSWSDEDAEVVKQWAGSHHQKKHCAIVGGHPFMEAWKTGTIRLPAASQEALERLRESAEGRPAILVTLQPNLTSEESMAPLLQVWRQQPRAVWWLRLHPMAADKRACIEALLASHSVSHWNITEATSLPLPVVLREATLHATHSSSSVIEAALLDVPSVIWSAYGEELFESHIRNGIAIRVAGGDAFLRALTDQRKTLGLQLAAPVPSRILCALQAILQVAP